MKRTITTSIILLIAVIMLNALIVSADPLSIYCATQPSMDTCLKGIALDRNDPSYCRDIEGIGIRNDCYSFLADKNNDESLCAKVIKHDGTYENVFDCYEDFLEDPEDINICITKILKGEYHDECIEIFIKMEDDPEMCSMLEDMENRMDCYIDLAADEADEKICDMMETNIDIDECEREEWERCDTETKVFQEMEDCKEIVAITARRNECRYYKRSMDDEYEESDEADLLFRKDDEELGTFHVEILNIDLYNQFIQLKITTLDSKRSYNLFIGTKVKHDFLNMMLIDLFDDNEGREDDEGEPLDEKLVADICFFKDEGAPRIEKPGEDEETEEEIEPEVTYAEEGDYEILDSIKEEKEAKPVRIEKEVGFVRKIINWFWGLFGFGK